MIDGGGQGEEEEGATDIHDPLERNELFELWSRAELYHSVSSHSNVFVKRVKSLIMRGCSACLIQSFILLLVGTRAEYRYGNAGPFRRASTGAKFPTLIYMKAIICLFVGCFCLHAWFRRKLLRRDVCIKYLVLRAVDWAISLWILFAALSDFRGAPFSKHAPRGLSGGEKLIYFVTLGLVCFALLNAPRNGIKLRKSWVRFRQRAYREFVKADLDAVKSAYEDHNDAERSVNGGKTMTEIVPILGMIPSAPRQDGSHVEIDFDGSGHSWIEPAGYSQYYEAYGHQPQSAAVPFREWEQEIVQVDSSSPLDPYARVSKEEFLLRWESMPESGSFQREIARIPSLEEIKQHLSPKGFTVIASDHVVEDGLDELRILLFAQLGGAVFLMELCLEREGMTVTALFKSQEETLTHTFISLLELQKILY